MSRVVSIPLGTGGQACATDRPLVVVSLSSCSVCGGDWSVGPPPRGRGDETGGARCIPTAPLRVKCQPGFTGSGSGSIRPSMRAGGTNLNCWLGPRSQSYCQMLAPGADVVTNRLLGSSAEPDSEALTEAAAKADTQIVGEASAPPGAPTPRSRPGRLARGQHDRDHLVATGRAQEDCGDVGPSPAATRWGSVAVSDPKRS
jgi:hypothetical protein